MSTEPKINQDSTRSQQTDNPNSWSSPKPSAGGRVKLDHDDLYPERIQRLGDYLSSSSANDPDNTDVTVTKASHFDLLNISGSGCVWNMLKPKDS